MAKRPSPKAGKKAITKEVHKGMMLAQAKGDILPTSETNSIKDTLSKLPAKRAKKEKDQLAAMSHHLLEKKHRRDSKTKRSHLTTPGETSERNSAPEHILHEGKRQIKTNQKKTLTQRVIFDKSQNKKR